MSATASSIVANGILGSLISSHPVSHDQIQYRAQQPGARNDQNPTLREAIVFTARQNPDTLPPDITGA
jgi:hypothetical protein